MWQSEIYTGDIFKSENNVIRLFYTTKLYSPKPYLITVIMVARTKLAIAGGNNVNIKKY